MNLSKWKNSRHSARLLQIAHFFTSQGLTLVANSVYGLLCIRLLPVADYTKFVVVFGAQATLLILMDVNLSATIVPLVGEHVGDMRLISDLIASLRRISLYAYLLVAAGLIVTFPFLVRNRGWSKSTIVAMIACLLVATWILRISSAYGSALLILRDRTTWYKGQLVAAVGTLALLGIFWAFHILSGFAAILINMSGFALFAILYYVHARHLLGVKGHPCAAHQKAILRLALPNIPQAIFYALQGQVPLLFITYFGRTGAVASVGALARLGAIFALLNQVNPIFVEPYFGRLSAAKAKKHYFATLGISALCCSGITLFAAAIPGLFLWVLGPQYSNLKVEVVIMIGTCALNTLFGVLWTINNARRFVYWWATVSTISLSFVVQALFFAKADLSSIRTVLYLNMATTGVSVAIIFMAGMRGFTGGKQTSAIHDPFPEAILVDGTMQQTLSAKQEPPQ